MSSLHNYHLRRSQTSLVGAAGVQVLYEVLFCEDARADRAPFTPFPHFGAPYVNGVKVEVE